MGKKNIRVSCHFLLRGIFLTQGLNPCLLHWQVDSLPLSYQGSPGKALLSVLPWGPLELCALLDELVKRHNEGLQSGWREDLLMRASNICLWLSAKGLKYMLAYMLT